MTRPSFQVLQKQLAARFDALGFDALETGTMLVLPSITFPSVELRKITGVVFYEERLLCSVLALRDERLRVLYVTSAPVDPAIVDYYFRWLDDVPTTRARLSLVDLADDEPRALSAKLLDRPDFLQALSNLVGNDAFIAPFNVTSLERRVAEMLGVPLYGIDPELSRLGTKSGSRRIARDAGVQLLDGAEDLTSVEEVEEEVQQLRARNPSARSVVIKLNNGFSGQGNAIVDLATLASPIDRSPTTFCAESESWSSYAAKIEAEGAVIEELVRHEAATSPSVQMRIFPTGEVEVLSTHDQILGGPDDQVYLGCRFPARPDYRTQIRDAAVKVASVLAEHGVIGPFGIDFVIVPGEGEPTVFLSEINLRMGGTTHPMIMAQHLTRGRYDPVTDEFIAGGRAVHYFASDNIKSPAYVGMSPQAAIDAVDRAGLSFDSLTNSGATLHLLGAVPGYGKLGALCIADSPDRAHDLYDSVIGALDAAAGDAR